ncbi:hypothetical protein ABC974_10045 [Sphingomonas oligophenolica]|uniref:Uncharacterized protein n=1 Tax=Sphingomonas oligophenolica TaxID=301154 RepID=A0ABU9Y2E3_9SPHN
MTLSYRALAISAAFLLAGGAVAAPQGENCHAIADPARRLACYDARDSGSAPPAAAPAPVELARRPAAPASADANPNRTFDSRVVAVSPLQNGFYRVRLADGSEWATTAAGQRPAVGQGVHHRRTFIGTHYFDTDDGRALTVRPER